MVVELFSRLDDYGVPILATAHVVWMICRARRMTKNTNFIDGFAIALAAMGGGGMAAEFFKWVDVGYWPVLTYISGNLLWNALPNLRERFDAFTKKHVGAITRALSPVVWKVIGSMPPPKSEGA